MTMPDKGSALLFIGGDSAAKVQREMQAAIAMVRKTPLSIFKDFLLAGVRERIKTLGSAMLCGAAKLRIGVARKVKIVARLLVSMPRLMRVSTQWSGLVS